MTLAVAFGLLAFLGVTTIVAAVWDYRLQAKRQHRIDWQNATSTTMKAGRTRHIVITYKEDGDA